MSLSFFMRSELSVVFVSFLWAFPKLIMLELYRKSNSAITLKFDFSRLKHMGNTNFPIKGKSCYVTRTGTGFRFPQAAEDKTGTGFRFCFFAEIAFIFQAFSCLCVALPWQSVFPMSFPSHSGGNHGAAQAPAHYPTPRALHSMLCNPPRG